MLLNNLFIAFGSLFALSIIIGKLFIFKQKDSMMVSNYIAFVTALIGIYSVLAFCLIFFVPELKFKALMLFFSLSPFILGQLATYRYEKLFTACQVALTIVSVIVCRLYF